MRYSATTDNYHLICVLIFRIDRGYDFTGVLEWFAERVDRIILLFDAHKLDISDEFKRCIEALSGYCCMLVVSLRRNKYISS